MASGIRRGFDWMAKDPFDAAISQNYLSTGLGQHDSNRQVVQHSLKGFLLLPQSGYGVTNLILPFPRTHCSTNAADERGRPNGPLQENGGTEGQALQLQPVAF